MTENSTNTTSGYRHPRYWPAHLGLFLLRVASRLPSSWQMPIGRLIGLGMRLTGSRRRAIAETNLKLCFPELDQAALDALLKKHFDHLGLMVLDLGVSWYATPQHLRNMADVSGLDRILGPLKQGQPVLCLMSHQTSMELGGQILALLLQAEGFPLQVMYKRSRNPVLENAVRDGRSRFTHQIMLNDDFRSLIRGMKNGSPSWYAPDQDFGRKHSVFAPFFGIETATITMPSRVASSTKAVVVPVFVTRSEDGTRIAVRVDPALENYPSGDDTADATQMNATLEAEFRQHPEQYFWVHRRFKTRPEGKSGLYPPRRKKPKSKN